MNDLSDLLFYPAPRHTAMTTYFAYGSNLLPEQMKERCPNHRFLGIAILNNYRFLIGERGYATIARQDNSKVLGALYAISELDESNLDRKEGVSLGIYRKTKIEVMFNDVPTNAMTYVDERTSTGNASEIYAGKILRGAKERDFPEEYQKFLTSELLSNI